MSLDASEFIYVAIGKIWGVALTATLAVSNQNFTTAVLWEKIYI